MAVQTRSVLKTYFETGDKPTSAQFGDLIDSALMANAKIESASFNAVANTVHSIATSSAITCTLSNLTCGESCVVNRMGNIIDCNTTTTFVFDNGPLYYATGYSDVSADAPGAISHAILIIAGIGAHWALINRAFYK